jgi:hypothetical protein
MFEEILVLLLINFINPADSAGGTMYPSGIKECDKLHYNFPPEATKAANLVLSMPVYDGNNILVPPGIYEAIIVNNNNEIILMQSNEIKGKLPVGQTVKMPQKCYIPTISAKKLSPNHILVIYKNDDIEAYSTLLAP